MVHAETGAEVTEGENIGAVEAMKVNYPLYAPTFGVVTWSLDLGEIVGEGEVVGEVE
jgi:biotin carboxyl carrier protein